MTAPEPRPGLMPSRLPEGAENAADFDPIMVAKLLLRSIRAGALATLDRNTGHPFGSLVNVANDADGSPLILISRLSTHTANLEHDTRASILLAETGKGDPLAHPRLTIIGRMEQTEDPRVRRRFLARHPKSELYAGFADFSFWAMNAVSAHLNGGFARAADLVAQDILTDLSDAMALVEAEPDAIQHLNGDHAEAVQLYAAKLLNLPDGPWSVTGIDPDGIDLGFRDRVARLLFRRRLTDPGQLRVELKELAAQARAR